MENQVPDRIFNNFDEFFKEMAKQHKLGNLHKDALEAHFETLKIKSNQSEWTKGFKHYLGIK